MQGQGLGEIGVTSKLHADGSGPTVWGNHTNVHTLYIQRPKPCARSLPL